jgi:hypothetical protein
MSDRTEAAGPYNALVEPNNNNTPRPLQQRQQQQEQQRQRGACPVILFILASLAAIVAGVVYSEQLHQNARVHKARWIQHDASLDNWRAARLSI